MKRTPQQPPTKRPTQTRFLFQLSLPTLVVGDSSGPLVTRLGSSVSEKTPLPVSGWEAIHGGPVATDTIVAELPAHLRVMFILQQMENEVISGGGVSTTCWAEWETTSSTATEENGGPYQLPIPGPGDVWPVPHANLIYDGLAAAGCGNTPIYPVEFESRVKEWDGGLGDETFIGDFSAVDNSTLQPNGFWTFAYTIRATGTEGGVSDFKFRGVVSITCTILEVLPG